MTTGTACCRTFSGKVRKLKQHRRASASRLRPDANPPANPKLDPPTAVDPTVQAVSLPIHASPRQPAIAQPDSNQAQHAQHGMQNQAMQQETLTVQHPGFDLSSQSAQQPSGQNQDLTLQSPGHNMLTQQAQLQKQRQQENQAGVHQQSDLEQQPVQLHQQARDQLPQQLPQQQLTTARRSGRRRRPTADAAGLACLGRAVQEGGEEARMTRSGPLRQEPSGLALLPVPELFEVHFFLNARELHTRAFPAQGQCDLNDYTSIYSQCFSR